MIDRSVASRMAVSVCIPGHWRYAFDRAIIDVQSISDHKVVVTSQAKARRQNRQ
jgi:hypothetical protein